MSKFDKILDDQDNLNTANDGVLEMRLLAGFKVMFSEEDWKEMGFNNLHDLQMERNPSNPEMISVLTLGKATIRNKELNVSAYYGGKLRDTAGEKLVLARISNNMPSEKIVLPLDLEGANIKEIQKHNGEQFIKLLNW